MSDQANLNGATNTAVQINLGGGIATLTQSVKQSGLNIFKGINKYL